MIKLLRYLKLTFLAISVVLGCSVGVLIGASASQPPSPRTGQSQRSEPHQQPAQAQQQPGNNPSDPNTAPVLVRIQPTPQTEEEAAKEQRKEQRETATHWWTIGLAVVTGIVGFLQLIMIGIQAGIMERQNEIMEGQTTLMNGQLKATEDAANAAKRSADGADLAMVVTQRAFLLAVRVEPIGSRRTDNGMLEGFAFAVAFQNSGHTPAKDVRVSVSQHITTFVDLKHPVPVFQPTDRSGTSALDIGPNTPFKANAIWVPIEQIRQILHNEIAFFLHAYSEYRDFFPGTPTHRTTVCFRLMLDGDPTIQPNAQAVNQCFKFRGGPPEHSDST